MFWSNYLRITQVPLFNPGAVDGAIIDEQDIREAQRLVLELVKKYWDGWICDINSRNIRRQKRFVYKIRYTYLKFSDIYSIIGP